MLCCDCLFKIAILSLTIASNLPSLLEMGSFVPAFHGFGSMIPVQLALAAGLLLYNGIMKIFFFLFLHDFVFSVCYIVYVALIFYSDVSFLIFNHFF